MLQLSLTPSISPTIAPISSVSGASSADFAVALAGVAGEATAAFAPAFAAPLPPERQNSADLADVADAPDYGDVMLSDPMLSDDTGDNSLASVTLPPSATRSDSPSDLADHRDGPDLADPVASPWTIDLPAVWLAVQPVISPIPVAEAVEPEGSGRAPPVAPAVRQSATSVPLTTPTPLPEKAAAPPPDAATQTVPTAPTAPTTRPVVPGTPDDIRDAIASTLDQVVRGTPSPLARPQGASFAGSIDKAARGRFADSALVPFLVSAPVADTAAAASAPPRLAQPPEIGIPVPALRAFAAAIAATSARPPRAARDDDMLAAPIITRGQPDITTRPADLPSRSLPSLDMRRDDWTRSLIDRIDAVRDVANARDTRITLVPDALGKIEVALRQEGETVHVAFIADAPETRALLADAQPRLAEIAEARGLRLGETAVSAGTDSDRAANSFGQPADHRRSAPSPQGTATNRSPTTNPAPAGADSDNRIA